MRSATVLGVTAIPVDVEVDASQGMPLTRVVGLPGTGVQESRVRVAAAIRNLEVKLPSKRRTVSGPRQPETVRVRSKQRTVYGSDPAAARRDGAAAPPQRVGDESRAVTPEAKPAPPAFGVERAAAPLREEHAHARHDAARDGDAAWMDANVR